MIDEPSIHDHETRITVIEKQCDNCPEAFNTINKKLDDIWKCIVNLKVENARSKGFSAALWGGGAGAMILGIAKGISVLFGKPQ